MKNQSNTEQIATMTECQTAAANMRATLARLEKPAFAKTPSGDKYTIVRTLNGSLIPLSSRVGEPITVLQKAKAYMHITNGDATASVDKAVHDVSADLDISYSAILDKFTRQFGITGDGAVSRARALFVEALKSADHRFDDLLSYLIVAKTRKDTIARIHDAYMSI
jgi:hypothetical protein